MLLIVRVDNEYPNRSAIDAASRAWTCGKMLDSADLRRKYRMVVPYSKKHGFIDVFCIESVYEDLPRNGRMRRVCFDLVPTNKKCKGEVLEALNDWLAGARGGVLRVQSVKYVDVAELMPYNDNLKELQCCSKEPTLRNEG